MSTTPTVVRDEYEQQNRDSLFDIRSYFGNVASNALDCG
jgi:hypothetical protein